MNESVQDVVVFLGLAAFVLFITLIGFAVGQATTRAGRPNLREFAAFVAVAGMVCAVGLQDHLGMSVGAFILVVAAGSQGMANASRPGQYVALTVSERHRLGAISEKVGRAASLRQQGLTDEDARFLRSLADRPATGLWDHDTRTS